MWDITPQLQKKINRLMQLKYEKHKKLMKWTRFFVVLYSVFVFFIFAKYLNFAVYRLWFRFEITHFFVLFLVFVFAYFLQCFLKRKKIPSKSFMIVYFSFYFLFLCPVLFAALSDLTFLWKLWKIIFWLSPLLFYFLRMYTVDFVWSGQFVRGIFKSKDIDVRNCPQCHEYILKKPIRYCPHCATDRFSSNGAGYNKHCKNCGFVLKIHDFDFPCCCPYCGLAFKRKILKNEIVW